MKKKCFENIRALKRRQNNIPTIKMYHSGMMLTLVVRSIRQATVSLIAEGVNYGSYKKKCQHTQCIILAVK